MSALTFRGCPNLQHSRTKHVSFWLLSEVFLIKIVVSRWEVALASFQSDDATMIQAFSYSELGCSSVFWLRTVCRALPYSTHRSLPTGLVPVVRTAYCSHWARCKKLNIAYFFCTFSLLLKGQSSQVDALCSCTVDRPGKLMFPFSAVPILYFPSPGILPVLSVES